MKILKADRRYTKDKYPNKYIINLTSNRYFKTIFILFLCSVLYIYKDLINFEK